MLDQMLDIIYEKLYIYIFTPERAINGVKVSQNHCISWKIIEITLDFDKSRMYILICRLIIKTKAKIIKLTS